MAIDKPRDDIFARTVYHGIRFWLRGVVSAEREYPRIVKQNGRIFIYGAASVKDSGIFY
jgi:hypothetical protein